MRPAFLRPKRNGEAWASPRFIKEGVGDEDCGEGWFFVRNGTAVAQGEKLHLILVFHSLCVRTRSPVVGAGGWYTKLGRVHLHSIVL